MCEQTATERMSGDPGLSGEGVTRATIQVSVHAMEPDRCCR